jgi:glycolate oxidase FAD binding subunit
MNVSTEGLQQRLSSALGSDLVRAPTEEDAFIDGVAPALMITPLTTDQVIAAVCLCREAGATMVPWGGGTAMAIGNPPRRVDVVIKLGKVARVIEHDAANLTVTAESGATLAALQTALGAEKQFSPLDAPFPERSSLGGTIAANLNGPRRNAYGSVRDLVIGIKAVLPTGEVIKGGGKVVKNVAGYDMSKLFVGSLGTLGILLEATVRVAPSCESAATFVVEASLAQAEELAREITGSVLLPAAVFTRGSWAQSVWQLGIQCEGFEATVERQLKELDTMADRAGVRTQKLAGEAHGAFWNELRDFPLAHGSAIYRVTLPRATIFRFLEASRDWNSSEVVCDAASGTIWMKFAAGRAAIQRFTAIESLARQQRGHAILFAAPPTLKTGVDIWGTSPASLSIMRQIKHQFDPEGLLNPGRFVGGL